MVIDGYEKTIIPLKNPIENLCWKKEPKIPWKEILSTTQVFVKD